MLVTLYGVSRAKAGRPTLVSRVCRTNQRPQLTVTFPQLRQKGESKNIEGKRNTESLFCVWLIYPDERTYKGKSNYVSVHGDLRMMKAEISKCKKSENIEGN